MNGRSSGGPHVRSPAPSSASSNFYMFEECVQHLVVDVCSACSTFVPTAQRVQHLGVYFFGGADDREALAYGAMRLVKSSPFALTVITQFWERTVDGQRVVYREEVRDGEDTVGVFRATGHNFSLLIIGRRNGVESPMTEGLSMWSEYPELGVVGTPSTTLLPRHCLQHGGRASCSRDRPAGSSRSAWVIAAVAADVD